MGNATHSHEGTNHVPTRLAVPGNRDFVHLHVHSEFSVLDGLGTVEDYAQRAHDLGMPAIALTDHGVMCGAPSFYSACRKAEVEPVLGEECYFVPDASYRPAKKTRAAATEGDVSPESGGGMHRYHVVMLAKGRRGYQVLSELSTETHKNFYYKPLLDRGMCEALGDDAKHLVVLSGCANSIISKLAMEDIDLAGEELTWWRETFPNFYIELQNHKTAFDRELNTNLLKLARRYNLPWVITNDPHYVVEEDCGHHDTLLAIQTASDVDDPNRFRFDGEGYHLKSRQEMRRAFKEYGVDVWRPGAQETTRIAKACRTRIPEWESRTWHIPNYPDAEDSFAEMKRLAWQGLRDRGLRHDQKYVDQLKHELRVFKHAGIADFMMITRWCIEEAKARGIPVGPGRGSVCGTLVGYLIGIHKIDPVRYDLLFERFLNPARPRMPDIDTDFGQRRREEMFKIVEEKFGIENVVHVCTYSRMRNKKAFQSLGKAFGISFPERIRISKGMPNKPAEGEDILPEEIRDGYPELADALERLSGVKSAIGSHPAGVIIASPEDHVRKLVPEMWLVAGKTMCGQYDLDAVEHMGLMKQDFLGLRTLDTIWEECVPLIKARQGIDIDPDSWIPDEEPDDDKVWAMLAAGHTAGVFQISGATNTKGIMAINPQGFEDVVSCTSLYRTGPIMAGYPKQFLRNRKIGKKRIQYAHPLLKPILERTWGVILYQEQVMEIGKVLAGFDDAGQDEIKEAIKHKKSSIMDTLRPIFVKGCRDTNDIPEAISTAIWKDIEGYAGYSYNRSHAVAYTFLTYQTARLKALFPVEFLAACLRTEDDDDKRVSYLQDAIRLGVEILPPDINLSDVKAMPDMNGANAIRFGFTDYKGIGDKQAAKIVAGRGTEPNLFSTDTGYSNIDEVEKAVNNVGVLEILKVGGALESIGVPGNMDRTEELLNWAFRDAMKKYRKRLRADMEFPRENGEYCTIAGEIFKATKGTTKTGKHFMTWVIRWSQDRQWNVRMWSETESVWSTPKGSIVVVYGQWQAQWANVTVGNKKAIKIIHKKGSDDE